MVASHNPQVRRHQARFQKYISVRTQFDKAARDVLRHCCDAKTAIGRSNRGSRSTATNEVHLIEIGCKVDISIKRSDHPS